MADNSNSPVQEFDAHGCFLVLLAFTSNFLWGGVFKILGLMLPTLRDQLDTEIWILGTMVSIAVATIDITGRFVRSISFHFIFSIFQDRHISQQWTTSKADK